MKIKIDLAQKGLAMIYKPYEILGWDVVWNSPEPVGSGAVWKKILKALGPGKKISRASVIFFLNRQVDMGVMGWDDATGKGGHHRRYYPLVSMTQLLKKILKVTGGKFRPLFIQAKSFDETHFWASPDGGGVHG